MVGGTREPEDGLGCSLETVGALPAWAAVSWIISSSDGVAGGSVPVSELTGGEELTGGIAPSEEVSSAPWSGEEAFSAVFSESISCTPSTAPVIPRVSEKKAKNPNPSSTKNKVTTTQTPLFSYIYKVKES